MVIRARRETDIVRCTELLEAVHASDGYPVNMPAEPSRFFVLPDMLGAWVAESDDRINGHVALRSSSSAPVLELASEATGVEASCLAVVARLFVAPWARRQGVGRALLSAAAGLAWELGRRPILDVVRGAGGAVALYEAAGWRRAGEVCVTFSDGHAMNELVYIAMENGLAWPGH
jgi:GNAT superfamily N-acetyltransferase